MVQQTNTTSPEWTTAWASSCPNQLPCGICRIMMTQCPKATVNYSWQPPVSPTCINESEGE